MLSIFLQKAISNTNWQRPNKRYLAQDIYLPSWIKQNLTILVSIDTSQSIEENDILKFVNEIVSIANSIYQVKILIVQCDVSIQSIRQFDFGEVPIIEMIIGRGGTDFRPVFNILKDYDVDVLIYFTDGDGVFPNKIERDIPILWVLTKHNQVPFGQIIYL